MAWTTSSSGSNSPCCRSAAHVIGWPCESSGGAPAARAAWILPSRSPQASAAAPTLQAGRAPSDWGRGAGEVCLHLAWEIAPGGRGSLDLGAGMGLLETGDDLGDGLDRSGIGLR